MRIDWGNLNKINVRELTDAQTKHLVIKALIVQIILIKHIKDRNYIRVYTEFPVKEGKICDVYYENTKTKEVYAYEIQSDISKKWQEETLAIYKDWEVPFVNTTDLIIIDVNKLSDYIPKLKEELKDLVL